MDHADIADGDTELILQSRITKIRQSAQAQRFNFTGKCRFCGDEVDEGGFCDTTCQRKFELKHRS